MTAHAPHLGYFDQLYARSSDPWGFRVRWYERRKRALTLAALPHARYRRALELGCANGELAAELADRCDQLLACDFNGRAVALARRRLRELTNTQVEQRQLPGQWPAGEFDLIVVSEVAYYLSDDEFCELLARAIAALPQDGVLVGCHWRHRIINAHRSGDQVHAALTELDLPQLLHHQEADFLLDIWAKDSRSVAQREGLA
ncbi:MAG: class I SAM-dependent methyltransferase [Gammaproteobacteria bacterium]|nr:class I SAM-dependent methyltransferase [Gammaproteobacteria bacterium]